ncbi:MAG: hypothetical protein ACOC32_03540 [Nanoarchaeota archaeon]
MRLSFVHYGFKQDGVTRVVLNNIRGLKEIDGDLEVKLVGGEFAPDLPGDIKQQGLDMNDPFLLEELRAATKDSDAVIIENPTIGKFPRITHAYKRFAESSPAQVSYRTHDLVDDRPQYHDLFNAVFSDSSSAYPEGVPILALTSFDRDRLLDKGLEDVSVLSNPVVASDLAPTGREQEFRELLSSEGIVGKDELMLSYPVRALERKNVEEALLITSLLSEHDARLVVSLGRNDSYQRTIEDLASEYAIPLSIGDISEYVGFDPATSKFLMADFLAASDYVLTTSVREGFGYAFLEPWVSGRPVFGRDISYVTDDFKRNGLLLDHLYDDTILPAGEDAEQRIERCRMILGDKGYLRELKGSLGLEKRMFEASARIENNADAIRDAYDYRKVAEQLYEHITRG